MRDINLSDAVFPAGVPSIPVTKDQLAVLAEKLDGWERLWGRIYGLLGMALDNRSFALGIVWPGDGAREEFIATMLEKFENRFEAGELFAGMPAQDVDLAKQLLAKTHLRNKAFSFLGRERFVSLASQLSKKNDGAGSTLEAIIDTDRKRVVLHDNRMHAEDHSSLREKLDRGLRGLTLAVAVPENPTVIEEQAGMQLQTRCDWSSRAMAMLYDDIKEVLRSRLPDTSDAESTLTDAHRRRREVLTARYDRAKTALAMLGEAARKKFALLVDTLNKTTFEFLFRPLDADSLMELLAIQRNSADMLRKRYREKLEELLRGNPWLDEALAPKEDE